MANPEEIGKMFVNHYYDTFDTNPQNLGSLYQEPSCLSMEGQCVQGPAAIMAKLQNFLFADGKPKFTSIKHQPAVLDCQPSLNNGIVIMVSGGIVIDGAADRPLSFTQTFQLMPLPQGGGYYCLNDIFRFNLA